MIVLFAAAAAAALNVSLVFLVANALTPKNGPLSTSGRYIVSNENAPAAIRRAA